MAAGPIIDQAQTGMDFNVNDDVLVKLTDHGQAVHAADHAASWSRIGRYIPYTPPQEDAQGWSRWQLLALMKSFGAHMGAGEPPCFEATIRLPT
jgi:hypothetical protein